MVGGVGGGGTEKKEKIKNSHAINVIPLCLSTVCLMACKYWPIVGGSDDLFKGPGALHYLVAAHADTDPIKNKAKHKSTIKKARAEHLYLKTKAVIGLIYSRGSNAAVRLNGWLFLFLIEEPMCFAVQYKLHDLHVCNIGRPIKKCFCHHWLKIVLISGKTNCTTTAWQKCLIFQF